MASKSVKLDFKNVSSHVTNVQIDGLEVTSEDYVRANIGQEIFRSKNFDQVLTCTDQIRRNLHKLGCFKTIETLIDSADDGDPSCFKVVISVEESNKIGGGVHTSIGNNEGSLSTSVYLPNVFGKGERLSAEYTYGTRNHIDYRLNYSSPLGLNPDKHLSASIFKSNNDFPWSKYQEKDTGLSIDIVTPFEYALKDSLVFTGSHVFTYEAAWRNLISRLDTTFDVREQSGHSLKSSFRYTNLIDRRDQAALPTNGGYLKTSVELAGLGGDVQFFRYNMDYQWTKTFLNYFTTQICLSKGLVAPLKANKNVLINDKFFLGGPLTLRGFSNRGTAPIKDDCALGNDAYWLAGAHLYTPLPFLHKHKNLHWLKTHSFANIGNSYSLSKLKHSISENRLDNLLSNTRLSVGTGLVIAFGNIARLELNYVLPLWKSDSDKTVNGLQFGIGINFN